MSNNDTLHWHDIIDRDGERAKREIHDMAIFARRSLGQRIRRSRETVARIAGSAYTGRAYSGGLCEHVE